MKPLLVSIAALLLPIHTIGAPGWWAALHGSYLTAEELAQVTFPQPVNAAPPMAQPAPLPPEPPAQSGITYLPKWYASAGGGALVPGSGKFAYESISAYIGAGTYATTVQEFTISAGKVQSCTMAGVSKLLYQFGFVSIGMTGLGGGCNSTGGDSGAAAATQGFASFHLGKSGISIVATGDKTFLTDGRQGAKITLGVSFGK